MQYLHESASMGAPQIVIGPSTDQSTLFGVIGSFRSDNRYQALQQKFERLPTGAIPKTIPALLPAAKTHIPPLHYGMVPFAGRFMTEQGEITVLK